MLLHKCNLGHIDSSRYDIQLFVSSWTSRKCTHRNMINPRNVWGFVEASIGTCLRTPGRNIWFHIISTLMTVSIHVMISLLYEHISKMSIWGKLEFRLFPRCLCSTGATAFSDSEYCCYIHDYGSFCSSASFSFRVDNPYYL